MIKFNINDSTSLVVSSVSELTSYIEPDHLDHFMEELSCEEAIVKFVTDQIIEGCTPDGSWASRTYSAKPNTAMDKAIRVIAENSSESAAEEIRRLTELNENLQSERDVLENSEQQLIAKNKYLVDIHDESMRHLNSQETQIKILNETVNILKGYSSEIEEVRSLEEKNKNMFLKAFRENEELKKELAHLVELNTDILKENKEFKKIIENWEIRGLAFKDSEAKTKIRLETISMLDNQVKDLNKRLYRINEYNEYTDINVFVKSSLGETS